MNKVPDFILESHNNYVRFAPDERDLQRNYYRNVAGNNLNIIEIAFRQEDADGWGAGGGEYISTDDISAISEGIKKITSRSIESFTYVSLDEIFEMDISTGKNGSFNLIFSMIETLCRDYYITIARNDLSIDEFMDITHPFVEWEKLFPTLDPLWLSLYHEAYDMVYQYEHAKGVRMCEREGVRCAADFNRKVFDILEDDPHRFGDFLKHIITALGERPDIAPNALADLIYNF